MVPALRPGRGLLVRVPLVQPPFLHRLRRRSPGVFASFAGTTRLSDSRRPFIEGLRPLAFPSRPAHTPTCHPAIHLDGASSALTGDRRASRFSRMEIPRMHRFSDRAGSVGHSRWRGRRCCLPPGCTASAPRIADFAAP
jgi:hypothetical protein